MAAVSWLKYAYLAHFSQPRSQRQLFRLVRRHKVGRIVEVGVGDVQRTIRLIGIAQRYADQGKVSYTGLDWFDTRPAELPPLTLKQAHRQLHATGATIRLVPGEPARSVATVANAHQHTGLVILSATVAECALGPAWFYLPRMLNENSLVLRELTDGANRPVFEILMKSQLVKMAATAGDRRAA